MIRSTKISAVLALAAMGLIVTGEASAQSGACARLELNPDRASFTGEDMVLTGVGFNQHPNISAQIMIDGVMVSGGGFVDPRTTASRFSEAATTAGVWLFQLPPHEPGHVEMTVICNDGATAPFDFHYYGAPEIEADYEARYGMEPFTVTTTITHDYGFPYENRLIDAYVNPRDLNTFDADALTNGQLTSWTTQRGNEDYSRTHYIEQNVYTVQPATTDPVILTVKPCWDCDEMTITIPASQPVLDMQWSNAGRISGMHCNAWNEAADPHTWNDNFLCTPEDDGFQFSWAGMRSGMDCISINEPSDPHTWNDNYFCVPPDSVYEFSWHTAGPDADAQDCVQVHEAADPYSWDNNFLCWSAK
jgi:hypothetical protein